MSELEPREAGIDLSLRRSLNAPLPSLPPDFDQRVRRELRQGSQVRDRYRRILVAGYGVISVVTSAVVMRGQGLNWGAIAAMILGPLVLVAFVPLLQRTSRTSLQHSAN